MWDCGIVGSWDCWIVGLFDRGIVKVEQFYSPTVKQSHSVTTAGIFDLEITTLVSTFVTNVVFMTERIISSTEEATVFQWLGLKPPKGKSESNARFKYWKMMKAGLGSEAITHFIEHSTLSQKELARLLNVSERTIQRLLPEQTISFTSSEKLIELARLFHKGIEVFGGKEKFLNWLHRENIAFRGEKPIDLMVASLGIDMVYDELTRIEHGIFS